MAHHKTPDDTPASGLAGIGKLLQQLQLPVLDLQAIAESQRKDMEALAQAHLQAFEGMQALAERRSEILKESLAQWQQALQTETADGADPLTLGAERAQQGLQQALAHLRELGQMEAASRNAVWQTVQDRMQDNFADLQKLLQPK
jgi:hypothetical protein